MREKILHYTPAEDEIKRIKFMVFSPEMIRKISVAEITVPDTYDEDGYPIEGGLMDQRLGVIDPGLVCKTCGGTERTCPGHFGRIELVRPVIHAGFVKHIYKFLNHTCDHCGAYLPGGRKKHEKCPECKEELAELKFEKPTKFYLNGKEILPDFIREWLEKISDSTVKKLGYDPDYLRPEWLVLTVLLVPSVKVRPSITLESGEKSEDDLTHKLVEIIRVNQKLKANIEAGAPQLIIEDLYRLLQYHVTTYFNNESPNIPPARHRSGRPLKTLAQRLKGKEGRFRYNLSGKRVNFSARTVISPDPEISINEVGVPLEVAKILTVPLMVNEWNIDYAKELIKREEYPRALYVIRKDGRRIKVTESSREKLLEDIGVGWVVERQLMDGDYVLFNRQPSLHRISMMCHIVRVMPGKTFRLNPTVCPPYNADFDGDEMNLHAIQEEEAIAEAKHLMIVEKQILSPRHGKVIIKPTEDHITGIYLLTHDETVLSKEEASRLLYKVGIKSLPKPDVNNMYSGKLIFSQILPNDLNVKEKNKIGKEVVIKKGVLEKGEIDSKIISIILEKIISKHSFEKAREFLDNMTRMGLEFITERGFSVSVRDYLLPEEAKKEIKERLEKMDKEIEKYLKEYKEKTLTPLPGMTLRETLESLIMSLTSNVRDSMGEVVEKYLGENNPSIIMAKIGARGSILNAIQMSAVIGQQSVRNKRPKRGFNKRILAFFKPGLLGGRERGFVYSNFMNGLEVDEFFLHAIGGRESIVNKSIRTAKSGYMQRRLVNALQDIIVWEDLSVRDAKGSLIQTIYGGDGRDPMFSSTVEEEDSGPRQDDVDTA